MPCGKRYLPIGYHLSAACLGGAKQRMARLAVEVPGARRGQVLRGGGITSTLRPICHHLPTTSDEHPSTYQGRMGYGVRHYTGVVSAHPMPRRYHGCHTPATHSTQVRRRTCAATCAYGYRQGSKGKSRVEQPGANIGDNGSKGCKTKRRDSAAQVIGAQRRFKNGTK